MIADFICPLNTFYWYLSELRTVLGSELTGVQGNLVPSTWHLHWSLRLGKLRHGLSHTRPHSADYGKGSRWDWFATDGHAS